MLIFLLFLQVETVRAVLKKELDLPIVEIADESAKLDGGDVLFTGKNRCQVVRTLGAILLYFHYDYAII
jgi:hypothetical protein